MYQKAILYCLEQHLTVYATGYKVSDVLRLFIKEEYHHTRIKFTLNEDFIGKTNSKITYR